jgi:glutamate dehydrogenase/leucine dehydrogenase
MTIYTGPVFDMARDQFHVIADYLEIPLDERERLLYPKRSVTVSCPIHGEGEVMSKLYHVLDKAFAAVMQRVQRNNVTHRSAAMAIGVNRVRQAKQVRGLFP